MGKREGKKGEKKGEKPSPNVYKPIINGIAK
jgi:hypothetical protein